MERDMESRQPTRRGKDYGGSSRRRVASQGNKLRTSSVSLRSSARSHSLHNIYSPAKHARARPLSASPLYRRAAKPLNISERAQSSLGFSWGEQNTQQQRPQGFDVADYIKQNGSAAQIHIGVNGRPTSDAFFKEYLRKCRLDLIEEAEVESQLELVEDLSSESSEDVDPFDTEVVALKQERMVPLCWEDQVERSEHKPKALYRSANTDRSSSTSMGQQPTTCTKDDRTRERLGNGDGLPSGVFVMLSWRDHSLMNWTKIHERGSSTPVVHIPTSSSSYDSPQTQHVEEYDSHYTSTATDSSELQSTLLPKLLANKSIEYVQNTLCVWVRMPENSNQDVLSATLFDVFVTDMSCVQPSTMAFTNLKMKHIMGAIHVMTVELGEPEGGSSSPALHLYPSREVKVTLMCCRPRKSLILSTKVMLPSSIHADDLKRAGVMEKFFRRRSNYCNQDEDEDRTDITVLVKRFPDLNVLDNNPDVISGAPPNSPSSLLPVSKYRPSRTAPSAVPATHKPHASFVHIANRWLQPYIQ